MKLHQKLNLVLDRCDFPRLKHKNAYRKIGAGAWHEAYLVYPKGEVPRLTAGMDTELYLSAGDRAMIAARLQRSLHEIEDSSRNMYPESSKQVKKRMG